MNLKLDLPAETEAKIRERVALTGQDVESFVLEAVDEKLSEASPHRHAAVKDWNEKLQALIDLHPQQAREADDRRESIYAGRGE